MNRDPIETSITGYEIRVFIFSVDHKLAKKELAYGQASRRNKKWQKTCT